MIANTKLEIQDIIEQILYKRRVNPGGYKYDFRLRMPTYLDPFIGKIGTQESTEQNGDLILFVKKLDRYIRIGQYYEYDGDHTSDPVIAIDYNYGTWIPIRIERSIADPPFFALFHGHKTIYLPMKH